jgi:hypothetical protein
MPDMDVGITCSIKRGEPIHIERTVTVTKEELAQFIPPVSSGGGGWAYAKEAEAFICSIVKEELFPDEVTPIEEMSDLKRIGVTALQYSFDSTEAGSNMGSIPIYSED